MESARWGSIAKPSRAYAIAGAATVAKGRVPKRCNTSKRPAISPGTATARPLVRLNSGTALPSRTNMSRLAAAGAVSR